MERETRMTGAEKLIREKLASTRDRCAFKKAWIPEGWACVSIESFARELTKDLQNASLLAQVPEEK